MKLKWNKCTWEMGIVLVLCKEGVAWSGALDWVEMRRWRCWAEKWQETRKKTNSKLC